MPLATTSKFASPVSAAEFSVHVKDPTGHLQHCHQRIERSLVTVRNAVFSLQLTDPVLRSEAAAALDYELALLQLLVDLHTQDEERSLFPRLRKTLSTNDPNSLQELMLSLESQHREQQTLLGALAVCLRTLSSTGTQSDEVLAHLDNLVGQLENALRSHMTIEETQLLPHCRAYLAQGDLDDMRREMWLRFNGEKPR